jgi:trans-2,3-dihydro-3-hydroxyanthranilate isomerase
MRHCYVLDVFTLDGAGGNPLGVVPDSVGLDDVDMQRIAADLGFSETVFIFWDERQMPRLRIFTPIVELPFAGHPLVGTAWLLLQQFPQVERVAIGIGEVTIGVEDDWVWIEPPAGSRSVERLEDASAIGTSVGIEGAVDAFDTRIPMHNLYLRVSRPAEVVAAAPDLGAIRERFDGVYLYSGSPRDQEVRSRYFAPALGVDEDPATGSAAIGLAEVERMLGTDAGRHLIYQGNEDMSLIDVSWQGDSIRLAGQVVKKEVRQLPD